MMNMEADRPCLGWEGINNRIPLAKLKSSGITYSSICPC